MGHPSERSWADDHFWGDQIPHPVPAKNAGTRAGHPRELILRLSCLGLSCLGSLFDQRGNGMRLRNVHGVAAFDFDDLGARPF